MIKVNLLPPGSRLSRAASLLSAVPWRQAGIGVATFLVFLSVWTAFSRHLEGRELSRLTMEWQNIQPQRVKLERVKNSLEALRSRARVLGALKAPEAQWSPRLNLLSDCLVADLWFSHLKFGPVTSDQGQETGGSATLFPLGLEGFALVSSEGAKQEGAPVARFLKKLKEHPRFPVYFKNAELIALKHRQLGKEDVSEFSILFEPTRS